MKCTIGRDQSSNIIVSSDKVSKRHCTVTSVTEGILVEDLDSTNHTYINNNMIHVAVMVAGDILKVAEYEFDYQTLEKEIKKLEIKARTSFKEEFLELKKLYSDYQRDLRQVDSEFAKKDARKRAIVTLLPVTISIPIMCLLPSGSGGAIMRIATVGSGAAVSAVMNILATNRNIKSKEEIENKKTELRRRFYLRYRCPKCSTRFEFRDIEMIEDDGKCFNCKAQFV